VIDAETAQFWQIVTAIGLTVTPLLARLGRRIGRTVEVGAPQPRVEEAESRAIIVGFGRVGQLVADMLTAHGKDYVAIDSDPELVRAAQGKHYAVTFGDIGTAGVLERLGIASAPAVILTMDEPVGLQRLVKRLRGQFPNLPIIVRARDALHAAKLYRAGASDAVPETLESSLQLSEAVLIGLGVPMGPVIASIHEKRDELRAIIMSEGQLDAAPKLKSTSLRERLE